jgi:hypothetical protein
MDEADGREMPGRNESECVESRKSLNEEADSLCRLEGPTMISEIGEFIIAPPGS